MEELDSRGLLQSKHMKKLATTRQEASELEEEMQNLVQELAKSDGLDSSTIEEKAEVTAGKASKIMETHLGEEPDTQEALEFCV